MTPVSALTTATLDRQILIDTREPPSGRWFASDLAAGTARRATLPTADYTVEGLEHVVLIERKTLQDLVACVGHGRARFERELQRMAAETLLPVLIVEASVAEVELRQYRGRVSPAAVLGSLCAWSIDYRLRTWWGGSPSSCESWARRLLAAIGRRADRAQGHQSSSASVQRGLVCPRPGCPACCASSSRCRP